MRVGTQTFSGLYQFTTNTLLVETAQAIHDMGSDILKMKLGATFFTSYHIGNNSSITNLLTLVRDEPSCRRVFDMPFRHYIAWTYAFSTSVPDWNNGYTSAKDQSNDYREFYDLTRYLLTNYNNSGKTFYLGHWEGDGYLCPNSNWLTNPTPNMVQGFINYLNNRQKAIDDAKAATECANVNVFGYAEANRVRDAIKNQPGTNLRMINAVIPYVTNLDYVSYSSYDMQRLDNATKADTLDYIEAHLPTNKATVIPGERVWIGEYNYGGSPVRQEPQTRSYIQWLLNYGRQAIPFVLFWEIYDNETNTDGSFKTFYLIDPNNKKAPCYHLHQRFLNRGRLLVAQFNERNGRLPADPEFVSLVSPLLDQPLPAPTRLGVANTDATLLPNGTLAVSGTVTQGVYGDDCATVSVFYGRTDGGTVRSAWEHSQVLGVNTNFNPATFNTTLTGLEPRATHYFRFYATNASGEAWAPGSSQYINTPDYRYRMKVRFSGYDRNEPLSDFPVLVSLNTSLPGFAYSQFASSSGADLRFVEPDSSMSLPHEIDEWNTYGTSRIWVRLPCLASTNDFIWAYWGNPVTTPAAWTTNGSVWSQNHELTWHLNDYADSTLRHPASSTKLPTLNSAGLIGTGATFNNSAYLDAGFIDLGNAFTLSASVKLDTTATNIQTLWANKAGGWNSDGFALTVNSYNTADQQLRFETGDGTDGLGANSPAGAVSFGQWHRLTAVVDREYGFARLYVDGADCTQNGEILTSFNTQGRANLARMTNSAWYCKGTIDEARIEPGRRSANWVWATWMTTASNSFLATCSSVTQQLPALSLTWDPAGLQLSWPGSGAGFSLYTATNLGPGAAWTRATNQPLWLSNQYQVALSTQSTSACFYRLQSP